MSNVPSSPVKKSVGSTVKLFGSSMVAGAFIVASGAPAYAEYAAGTPHADLLTASGNVEQVAGTLDAFEAAMSPVVYALIGIGLTLASVKVGFRLFRRSIGA